MSDIEKFVEERSGAGGTSASSTSTKADTASEWQARDHALREELLALLRGGNAHRGFDEVIKGLPPELRGAKPTGQPFTPWRLLEHIRLSLRDILEFSRDPGYVSPPWPEGYWPEGDAPPHPAAWDESITAFREDLQALEQLVADPATDLFNPIPHGTGQTILREALVAADHIAYHLGELVLLRRLLGAWPERS